MNTLKFALNNEQSEFNSNWSDWEFNQKGNGAEAVLIDVFADS